ncbi:MAG: glycosyltransferase [Planctomycetaceae bacterium]|nr:glycosyltransferase [Planctomycetaceae bacterium]
MIVPVKNESKGIMSLLNELSTQTRQPDEIVIADGGSTDDTENLIREWSETSSIPVTLVVEAGALPGRNRNLAVQAARSEWIAAIDAGIHPPEEWLESLVQAAEAHPNARVVFGRYAPVIESRFSEYAAMTYVGPSDVDRRSIATCLIEKGVWGEVGGCPEHLRASEDLLFFKRLDRHQIPIAYSLGTPVRWELQPSFLKTFCRFAVYSRHGMRAGLFHDWQYRVTLQYVLLLGFIMAGFLWTGWFWGIAAVMVVARSLRRIAVWHHSSSRFQQVRAMLNPFRVCGIAAINIVIDLAMFVGMGQWLVRDAGSESRKTPSASLKSSRSCRVSD